MERRAVVTCFRRYEGAVPLCKRSDASSAGGTLTGHEFHYSSAHVGSDARFAFDVERGDGIDDQRDGLQEYRTLGTYCHVHPESGAFDIFVRRVAGEA
jgi:cobyrinic acid a,c-diamide synthase